MRNLTGITSEVSFSPPFFARPLCCVYSPPCSNHPSGFLAIRRAFSQAGRYKQNLPHQLLSKTLHQFKTRHILSNRPVWSLMRFSRFSMHCTQGCGESIIKDGRRAETKVVVLRLLSRAFARLLTLSLWCSFHRCQWPLRGPCLHVGLDHPGPSVITNASRYPLCVYWYETGSPPSRDQHGDVSRTLGSFLGFPAPRHRQTLAQAGPESISLVQNIASPSPLSERTEKEQFNN